MRLSDLRDKMIRTLDGQPLGRVHEVHCDKGKITAIMCGARSLIERWTSRRDGHRIAWERVVKVGRKEIVVAPEAPEREARTGASRTRPGTRRPSAPRSRR